MRSRADRLSLNRTSDSVDRQDGINSPDQGRIRPFADRDIPQVARLHNRIWHIADDVNPDLMKEYQAYFSQAFLRHPWWEERYSSLIHEEPDGRITGFLGSLPRKMKVDSGSVQLRIASQFFVDPGNRGFIGIRLAKAFLDGPQDLSLTDEANASARMIWERFGGAICSFSSLRWLAVLRPCGFSLMASHKAGVFNGTVTRGLAPVAKLVDALGARIPKNPLCPVKPQLSGEELDSETLALYLSELAKQKKLRPDYDTRTMDWLLRRASQLSTSGTLQKVLVKAGKIVAGWYIYYVNPNGLSEVVQLCAKDRFADGVVEHLFYDAWQQGASVLIGRPDEKMLPSLSKKHCVLYSSPRQWMMVHSRRPELANAFLCGDAFFSRLDGEWCLHFR